MSTATAPRATSYDPTITAPSLAPVAPGERIAAIDQLRGWAMFGVLWSNLNDWYGTVAPRTTADHALSWTQTWLVESRFYTLLCLLFGIGFGIQLLRARERGADVRATYWRRSAALLAIGIIHGTLIWNADILTMYALAAFALVMFRDLRTSRLLPAALFLWVAGPWIASKAMFVGGLRFWMPAGLESIADGPAGFANGSWLHVEHLRLASYLEWYRHWPLTQYWTVIAMFLAGLWALKSGYLQRVINEPRSTRRLLAWSIVIAAIGYAVELWWMRIWPPPHRPLPVSNGSPGFWFFLFYPRALVFRALDWATEATAVAYAAGLLLLWRSGRLRRLLRALGATGRMALTTYLTQSIVCTLLFYGYGLGWYGRVGFTGMLIITLVLFGIQMAVSVWWLERFRFGPAEWLWRTVTYGRAPRMRVAVDDAPAIV